MKKEVLLLNALAVMERLEQGKTANGALRQTAQRNKVVVSVKRRLGNIRGAIEILSQARELTDYLKTLIDKPVTNKQ